VAHKLLGLIPARSGSLRVPGKNVRRLAGHPLIAYAIASARESGLFSRIVVTTNSPETQRIALHYGAEAPFLRPDEISTSTSPDIDFLKHAFAELGERFDYFALLRTTSPFRSAATIQRAWEQLRDTPEADSIRAVELCTEHPGKMWVVDGKLMRPFLEQSHLELPWHARQYQDLPQVYVQNSALEIARFEVVERYHSREGQVIAPFLTDATEGFSIDYEEDWLVAERWLATGRAVLPVVQAAPYDAAVASEATA
jgi:N-acylneuraminate cytidylyltransferase